MNIQWKNDFVSLLGEKFITDESSIHRLSKDYYWYSPILKTILEDKTADGIAVPTSEEEVYQILSLCYKNQIPVTVRGRGTGNYGQAVPLAKGIVLDLSQLKQIIEIGDGYVQVQAGVRIGVLEKELRTNGYELCCYPSTYVKATIGGFVAGGSGGIGSISHGTLWDGNVLGATVYTLEEEPRKLSISGPQLMQYIHSYGTVGVITELKIRTVPKIQWEQTIVAFDELSDALAFTENLSKDEKIKKRLVSVVEWPIPSYFTPFSKYLEDQKQAVLLETDERAESDLTTLIKNYKGTIKHKIAASQYHQTLGLSDFTWNHTTLWALKVEPTITYLQARFSPETYTEQIRKLKERFGDEILLHFEWISSKGRLSLAGLPIIQYQSKERLYEIIDFMNANDIQVNNPHTFVLNTNSRAHLDVMLQVKKSNDPRSLFNPGKMKIH